MKKLIIYISIIALSLSLVSCKSTEEKRYQAQFLELFDTLTQVIAYTADEDEFSDYADEIYSQLDEYHKLYDIYNDYPGINNIKTINDNAGIAPVEVDQRIIDLIKFGFDAYDRTSGKLNIAYGAVLRIWHDYREEGTDDPEAAKLPPIDLLEEASLHVDIKKVIIDEVASTVFLEDPQMRLDVGAIAKGYAVERTALALIEDGFTSGLISVGGNIRSIGEKPDGNSWNLGVQNPDSTSEIENLHILFLKDTSLVTSGDYIRYYTVEDRQYHHIIDPETLYPSDYFRAVTVVCHDSGDADVLSTALFMMPYEDGLSLLQEYPGSHAMWVLKDGSELYSSGFMELTEKTGP
ncbi:MAG TPA: FAD:protein FMN transferase [Clostridia bacterium]|nr:FAD:protein FMN transferase [Clostridia bacterium]